jgi:hypothetical protein
MFPLSVESLPFISYGVNFDMLRRHMKTKHCAILYRLRHTKIE